MARDPDDRLFSVFQPPSLFESSAHFNQWLDPNGSNDAERLKSARMGPFGLGSAGSRRGLGGDIPTDEDPAPVAQQRVYQGQVETLYSKADQIADPDPQDTPNDPTEVRKLSSCPRPTPWWIPFVVGCAVGGAIAGTVALTVSK